MRKLLWVLLILILLIVVAYAFGPKPNFEMVDPQPVTTDLSLGQIEDYIAERDAKIPDLKAGNEGRLIWNDSLSKEKTEYVVLYIHGFSASGVEGEDAHFPFAKAIGANLYVPRLIEAGRETIDTYKSITPKQMMDSAKEAVAVAKLLGDKIILISCSTGGTYAAYFSGYDPQIHSLIMLSPNIDLADTNSDLILKPWGSQLLRIIEGGDYHEITHYNDAQKEYWNSKYHIDGIIALKHLIGQTMKKEHFEKITQPTLVISFYKNEEVQDKVVSVARMRDFFKEIGTPTAQKKFVECGECQNHVIGSELFNTNSELVLDEMLQFATNTLGLSLISDNQ